MHYSRVFLIDDDHDDQELFLLALDKTAPTVQCFVHSDAKTALAALEDPVQQPDLIFLDLNMPLMSGQQFLAELNKRERPKKIPVIILTTSSDQRSIEETRALGAEKFVTKPSNFRDLKNILQQILV